MDINQASLQMHYDLHGKIEVISRKKIETREDLSLAYTPGVAEPCRVIAKDYEQSFKLTRRSNLVAVITDGTASFRSWRYWSCCRYAGYGRKVRTL